MAVLDDDYLLAAIIAQVNLASNTDSALHACLLVCRRWKAATLPYLYGTTVLTETNFVSFATQFNTEYCPLIKSLTFRFGTESNDLQLFAPIIGTLCQLTTFSFYHAPEAGIIRSTPSGSMLTPLIESLPESCINLELELERHHPLSGPPNPHLCDALRAILPRMRHVRLQLDTVCASLLGEGGPLSILPTNGNTQSFNPISLPNMESMVVNCLRFGGKTLMDTCHLGIYPTPGVWSSVTQAFQLLTKKEASHKESAKFYVIGCIGDDNNDKSIYTTFTRSEMLSNSTCAMPARMVWMTADTWLLRDSEGREFMSRIGTMMPIVEGEMWTTVNRGARVPTAMLVENGNRGFVAACLPEKLRIRMSREWREENPKKMCWLWRNESVAGVSLLEAEKREGDDFLSQLPIVENTPRGWARNGFQREELERE